MKSSENTEAESICGDCGEIMEYEYEKEMEGWTTWECPECGKTKHGEGKYG